MILFVSRNNKAVPFLAFFCFLIKLIFLPFASPINFEPFQNCAYVYKSMLVLYLLMNSVRVHEQNYIYQTV
jgi:hypothetical protein